MHLPQAQGWGIVFGSRCASEIRDMYLGSHEEILSDKTHPHRTEAVFGSQNNGQRFEEMS
jgi:hypothetical protein